MATTASPFYTALPPLRDIVQRYAIAPEKKLGQNFLFDLNLTDRVARAAGDISHCTVIEIGPGPGGLTRALLANGAKHVVAIEHDKRCYEALQDYLLPASEGRLTLVHADALKVDEYVLAKHDPHIKIVANLPYNISTVLLTKWLDNLSRFEGLTLMFQKEVAERLTAHPRTKDYGRLSVLTQWLCVVHHAFDISPKAFVPPPKVTSTVVSITPRPAPLAEANKATLQKLLHATFQQRRKMLRGSLRSLVNSPEELLSTAGIDPTRRPEELSVEEFCRLARMLAT